MFKHEKGLMTVHQSEHFDHEHRRLAIAKPAHVHELCCSIPATEPEGTQEKRFEAPVLVHSRRGAEVRDQATGRLLIQHAVLLGQIGGNFGLSVGLFHFPNPKSPY